LSSTPEPEFDREQYEMLAALAEYEADLGPHGQPMSEAISPAGDPNNKDGRYYYAAGIESAPGLPVVDFAAQARERAEAAYFKKYPDADRAGLIWLVRKVERRPGV
jgi:hypothetical protein